jgi:serine/threonine protein kinase
MIQPINHAKLIFLDALASHPPEQWEEYADGACRGDSRLRARVADLLQAHQELGSIREDPPANVNTIVMPHMVPEAPETVIGPYKLLRQIGEGGMGVVYLAMQTHPVQRKVALKLIKAGMDSRQVIARFEAERQALALMDHANIARVFDAGTTAGGRPYFVMELVHGVPITTYCDDNRLTLRQRLELFVPALQAVQHAHQKGIIHRDLKPSNILIAEYDDRAVPKIIDFGVAKAVGGKLTDKTMFTQFGQLVGTLEYMSPEQAKFNQLDVDTRTDIYALGVLLYELLTGTTPFGHDRLHAAGFDEVLRILRDEEPQKPSTRLTTINNLPSVAAKRHIEPARLSRLVRGELDWIVMKALEKDRNRRYETANGFASDVQRYLADEAVQACPPSAAYRLRKLARRNKATVVGAVLVLASLIGGIVGTSWQAVRATEERNEKEQARRESVANERKAVAEAARALDQEALTQRQRERAENNFRLAREAVDQMLTRVAEEMAGKPHMEQIRRALLVDALTFYQGFLQQKSADPSIRHETARAYLRVGRIYILLGRHEEAEAPLKVALGLMEQLSAEFPAVPEYRSELADSHNAVSGVYSDVCLAQPKEWLKHALAALTVQEKLAADFPERLQMRRILAQQWLAVGVAYSHGVQDTKEGERYLRQGLAAWEQLEKESPEDRNVVITLSRAHHWLGFLFKNHGRLQEAEAEFRTELAIRAALAAPEPFYDSMTKAYLAELLLKTGRAGDAEPLVREVIESRERGLDDFPDIYQNRRRLCVEYELLGQCLAALGRSDEAERAFRQCLAMSRKLVIDFGDEPGATVRYQLAWKQYNFGLLLQDTSRSAEAAELFRQALLLFEECAANSPDSPLRLHALAWFLADCPATQFRDPPRAVKLAKQALQLDPQSERYWGTLGVAQGRAGQWQDASASCRKCMELAGGGDSRHWYLMTMAEWHQGNKDQARVWYDQAVRWMEAHDRNDEEFRRSRAEAEEQTGFEQKD